MAASYFICLALFTIINLVLLFPSTSSRLGSWNSYNGTNTHTTTNIKGFQAPLIHQRSRESPYFNESATHDDLLKEALWRSRRRASHFANMIINSGDHEVLQVRHPIHLIDTAHVMRFGLGTPPVNVYTLIDTGSDLIWLQCEPCNPCQKQRVPGFDPTKSKTYRLLSCNHCKEVMPYNKIRCKESKCIYELGYLDKTTTEGTMATDAFVFSDFTLPDRPFGCGTKNIGTPGSYANPPGVMGLSNTSPSLVQGILDGYPKRFSYCTEKQGQSTTVEGPVGNIKFGGLVPSSDFGQSSTTALQSNYLGLYVFSAIEGLYVNGRKLKIPDSLFQFVEIDPSYEEDGGLIDTGSSVTSVLEQIMPALVERLMFWIRLSPRDPPEGYGWPLCYDYKEFTDPTLQIPKVELRFKDKHGRFEFLNNNLWTKVGDSGDLDLYYLGLQVANPEEPPLSILGMDQMLDYRVSFDLDANKVAFNYVFSPIFAPPGIAPNGQTGCGDI